MVMSYRPVQREGKRKKKRILEVEKFIFLLVIFSLLFSFTLQR
jgi:hypothetical protein